jgi:hypothetical protein
VAYNFLLIGPCSLPSGPFFNVYITTTVTSLPFFGTEQQNSVSFEREGGAT